MILILLYLSLASVIMLLYFGNTIGIGCLLIVLINSLLSFFLFIYIFFFCNDCYYTLNLGYIVEIDILRINIGFFLDSLNIIMLFVIYFISTIVYIYSFFYMLKEPHLYKFISYLTLFVFFMLILVLADNFIILFFGWEGVSICSYLLISFWNTRIFATQSALKALVVNKIGDSGFIIALFFIFYLFGSFDFLIIFSLVEYYKNFDFFFFNFSINSLFCICLFLIIGVIGKSAQLGLHVWLPDAMEGPTPVSALLHSATMVVAGVYLIIRCSIIFECCPKALNLLIFVGVFISTISGIFGIVQDDYKKVIAYSTCSQLGYMVCACGYSEYSISLLHLSNHAFFKTLLFLCSGSVIHSLLNEQDSDSYGGLFRILPCTYIFTIIASFSLCGIPTLSGSVSKDLIIELPTINLFLEFTEVIGWLYTISGILSVFYSSISIRDVFFKTPNFSTLTLLTIHETDSITLFLLSLLSITSILSGVFLYEIINKSFSNFLIHSIYFYPDIYINDILNFTPPIILEFASFCSLFGLIISLNLVNSQSLNDFLYLSDVFNFDYLFNYNSLNLLNLSYNFFYILIEKNVFEFFGPLGFSRSIFSLSRFFISYQTGFLYNFFCLFIFNLLIFLYFLIFLI